MHQRKLWCPSGVSCFLKVSVGCSHQGSTGGICRHAARLYYTRNYICIPRTTFTRGNRARRGEAQAWALWMLLMIRRRFLISADFDWVFTSRFSHLFKRSSFQSQQYNPSKVIWRQRTMYHEVVKDFVVSITTTEYCRRYPSPGDNAQFVIN